MEAAAASRSERSSAGLCIFVIMYGPWCFIKTLTPTGAVTTGPVVTAQMDLQILLLQTSLHFMLLSLPLSLCGTACKVETVLLSPISG